MVVALKTASMVGVHIGVAAVVGYILTGSWVVGGALAVVEPLCNVAVVEIYQRLWRQGRWSSAARLAGVIQAMIRNGGMVILHMVVAALVGWALTGSWVLGGALAVVEPVCNVVAYHVHEWVWSFRRGRDATEARTARG